MNAAGISRLLREGGLHPLGGGTPRTREGVRVSRVGAGVPGIAYVSVSIDSPTQEARVFADVIAILADRFKIVTISERVIRVLEREQTQADAAIASYRAARTAWIEAGDKADAAFLRWHQKLINGEPTNAAQATRLQNEASYRSADLSVAQGALYALEIDPHDIDDEDDVERTPLGA